MMNVLAAYSPDQEVYSLHEARSAVLLVPSVIATLEWNALVNPLHPDAGRLIVSSPEKVVWDKRLFERPIRVAR